MAMERSERSCNEWTVEARGNEQASALLQLQWIPEQRCCRLTVSRETLCRYGYADQTHRSNLWENLRFQKQKRKRDVSVQVRQGQTSNRRGLSERSTHIKASKQSGHWQYEMGIGANHKQTIVTVGEIKSGYALLAKVSNNKADLLREAIVKAPMLFGARVRAVIRNSGKEFSGHAVVDEALNTMS